jgi:hypothetical protein
MGDHVDRLGMSETGDDPAVHDGRGGVYVLTAAGRPLENCAASGGSHRAVTASEIAGVHRETSGVDELDEPIARQ